MRLNQYLASQTGQSRRQCDELIKKGFVELDGEIASFTDPVSDESTLRIYQKEKWVSLGKKNKNGHTTILFYKPIFTVSTKSDPNKRKTIYDLLPPKFRDLNYAGRLDYMSEGLMVLSSNGDLVNQLTHPSFGKQKSYLVCLKYPLTKDQIKEMEKGLYISKDNLSFAPIKVEKTSIGAEISERLPAYPVMALDFLKIRKEHYAYVFLLEEGQNNQIRKMCDFYGQDVIRLVRLEMGPYKVSFDLFKKKYIEL
jgi:23S rRNA pseudouridine2605 synthase